MNNKKKLPGFDELASLETFDPKAFISSDKKEQEVCNFILSLALAYNDLKNVTWAEENLKKTDRDQEGQSTTYNGQYSGFVIHLDRLHFALMNEIFKLIENNSQVLEHPLMAKTIKLISKEAKYCWHSLVGISLKKDIKHNLLKKVYHRVRNKITYHADIKEVMAGYKEFFLNDKSEPVKNAYISRGISMSSTRFYFADAAMQGYLSHHIGEDVSEFIKKEANKLFDDVNRSLYEIITRFINNVRGYPWRQEKNKENRDGSGFRELSV